MALETIQSRTTPLGVVAWSNGIRIYSQADSGDLREAYGDLGLDNAPHVANFSVALPAALLPRDWRAGEAQGPAALGTAIAPIQLSDGEFIRIYYQMPDMRLGELCKDGRDSDQWYQGEYTTEETLPGTSIAVVRDETLGPRGYHVFFQGEDEAIYQSTHIDQWQPPRKIVDSALPRTVLSGVAWGGGQNLHLYYQGVDGVVSEIFRVHDGQWAQGKFATQIDAGANFVAVAWDGRQTNARANFIVAGWDGPQVRLYAQESNFDIIEWAWAGSWRKTDFRAPAFPHTDIKAVTHQLRDDTAILLYFVGPDKILHERVQMGAAQDMPWKEVEYVAITAQTGDFVGQAEGIHFTDLDVGRAGNPVGRIIVNSGLWIESIQVEYTDGRQPQRRGGNGGNQQVFELQPNEDIIQVLARGNYRVQTIQFITSSGRQSPEYGSTNVGNALTAGWGADFDKPSLRAPTLVHGFTIDAGPRKLWEHRGQPLAGFAGSADDSIRSLRPLWSTRTARVGSKVLQDLRKEASIIEDSKNYLSSMVERYKGSIPKMKSDLVAAIKPDTDAAIQQTIKLGEAAVTLSTASGSAKREIIGTCKGIAKKVSGGFDAVYAIATSKLSEFDSAATDIVFWESQTDSKLDRVREMLRIAEATSKATQHLRDIKQEAVDTAKRDIEKANQAKQKAERDKAAKKRERRFRDVFTLGLGEAGDWGGLNSAIKGADKIIHAAEGNLRSANQAMTKAQSSLRITEKDIKSFGDLKTRLSGFPEPLRTLKATLDGQRIEVLEIHTTAFDITVFMGALTATSAPLENIKTAADFARGIQKLQDIVQANIKLAGSFIEQTNIMDDALKEILASDVEPTDLV